MKTLSRILKVNLNTSLIKKLSSRTKSKIGFREYCIIIKTSLWGWNDLFPKFLMESSVSKIYTVWKVSQYGLKLNPHLDTFHAVISKKINRADRPVEKCV